MLIRIYYSGDGSNWAQPEVLLGTEANVMLTYVDCVNKPDNRMKYIHQARVLGKPVRVKLKGEPPLTEEEWEIENAKRQKGSVSDRTG